MPPPPTIKVKVKRNADTREVKITSSHELGTFMNIAMCMHSSRIRKSVLEYVHNGYELQYTIGRMTAITPEAWATAIAAEIRNRLCPPRIDGPIEGETVLTTDDSVYMALNNTVYKLMPTDYVPATRALTTMRRQIRERCKNEGQTIIRVAQEQANSVMAAAGEKMHEANVLMAEARKQAIPPSWAVSSQYAVKRSRDRETGNTCWHIGFSTPISIIHFEFEWTFVDGERMMTKKRTWTSINPGAKYMFFWVPIAEDGSYSQRSIYLARGCECLPHISESASCMGLGGAPPRLRSNGDVLSLSGEISRVMQIANLGSLLCHGNSWAKHYQDAIPSTILQGVLTNEVSRYQRDDTQPTTETATPVPTGATTNETWRLPRAI